MDGPRSRPRPLDEREPVWDLPWRRFQGRSAGEIRSIGRRFLGVSLVCWFSAAVLFVIAALALIPGSGPEFNVLLVLLSFAFAIPALMVTSVWVNMDRAVHGEPRLDPEWAAWQTKGAWRKRLLMQYAARLIAGLLLVLAILLGIATSNGGRLALAGALILILLVLVGIDYRRRRGR